MNIDTLKALMNAKGGVARSNQFAVTMPAFDNTSSADMNILCQSVNLPGRQIMTQERLIGLKGRKMPTGFAQDDVNMSFLLLNDYGAKRNIEAWMEKVINQDTYEIGYTGSYSRDVTIKQLRKGVSFPLFQRNLPSLDLPSTITNRFPTIGPIDFAQGEVDLDFHFRAENVKYQCVLRDAFPTTMSAVELNNELDGLLQVNVQISYRTWESI
tara:strand:- start:318 stop:953 length:636 start_codon:yes stop_codon:yes gene_type:complete